MEKMIIMLENNDSRYEFYMKGIKRSNVDDTIVRWELRYDYIHRMVNGSSHTTGNRILCGTFETIVEKLHHIDRGYEEFEYKLQKLGGKIYRFNDENENQVEKGVINESRL